MLSFLVSCALTPLVLQVLNLPVGASSVNVTSPASPSLQNLTVVYSDFLGLSLELGYINLYFGNSTDEVPPEIVNYLTALHDRSQGRPLRLRLGGNSMDSATYVPSQQTMIVSTDPNANSNDPIINFGPSVFDVMNTVSSKVGGAQYLIGLSLRDPNSTNIPLLAGDAELKLGNNLDAFLVGNEPDLYTNHGDRPNMANYSVNDYIGDYWVVTENLQHTPDDGNVLTLNNIAGPTICCDWDLASVLQSGWLNDFNTELKYITLQHYPQDDCTGHWAYGISYYLQHSNAVTLAKWQEHGVELVTTAPEASRKPLLMDEFNTASCGGIPNISDTFAATLWSADYALQLASVGYSGAYLHTREPGVTYNIFNPPAAPGSPWFTGPGFYSMLVVAEALQPAASGNAVLDLNVGQSMWNENATSSGYAIYDVSSSKVSTVLLFNFANASGAPTTFSLDASFFNSASGPVTVRYLTSPSVNEKTNISWGGQTYAGVADGSAVASSTQWTDRTVSCSAGCSIDIPGPGAALVFVAAPNITSTSNGTSGGSGNSSGTGSAPGDNNNTKSSGALGLEVPWLGAGVFAALLAVGL